MSKKVACVLLIAVFLFANSGIAQAASEGSVQSGAASLLIPGLGQYMNGEHKTGTGQLKMAFFVLAEIGAIVTTAVVGGVVGYPQIWIGIGIFIGNHVLSALDAYMNAPNGPEVHMSGTGAR